MCSIIISCVEETRRNDNKLGTVCLMSLDPSIFLGCLYRAHIGLTLEYEKITFKNRIEDSS